MQSSGHRQLQQVFTQVTSDEMMGSRWSRADGRGWLTAVKEKWCCRVCEWNWNFSVRNQQVLFQTYTDLHIAAPVEFKGHVHHFSVRFPCRHWHSLLWSSLVFSLVFSGNPQSLFCFLHQSVFRTITIRNCLVPKIRINLLKLLNKNNP